MQGGKTSNEDSLKNSKFDGKHSSIPSSSCGHEDKGGKKVAFKAIEMKLEADLPKNANILMDCEAVSILEGIQDYLEMLSNDSKIRTPESFPKALGYVQSVAQRYTNPQEVSKALLKLKDVGVSDAEICMISNVGPEVDDEVYALIPSLKCNKKENKGSIGKALAELAKLKQPKLHEIT